MKKYAAVIFICVAFTLIACNKTAENGVLLRVENHTAQNFKEVLTNNKSFNNVAASTVTDYQHLDKAVALPWATLINTNNDTAFAGALYYDPPVTYLTSGKYTLKIVEDTSAYYGYNCEYIKN